MVCDLNRPSTTRSIWKQHGSRLLVVSPRSKLFDTQEKKSQMFGDIKTLWKLKQMSSLADDNLFGGLKVKHERWKFIQWTSWTHTRTRKEDAMVLEKNSWPLGINMHVHHAGSNKALDIIFWVCSTSEEMLTHIQECVMIAICRLNVRRFDCYYFHK